MKAIRWSIQLSSLIALSFALTVVEARADANSVVLENATGGPFAAFNGSGQVIGMIESDIPDTSHVYFVKGNFQLINIGDNPPANTWPQLVDTHATEVAGVMISTDVTTIGVAPGAGVYAAGGLGGYYPTAGPTNTALDFQTNVINAINFLAAQPNLHVINMSIGLDSVIDVNPNGTDVVVRTYNTSGTSVWERAMDNIASTKAVSIVVAAGNEGKFRSAGANSDGGTNSVGEQAGAYNLIAVGSVTNAPAGTATNMSFFSSRGYLANGRSAVAIVAPGEGINMPTTNVPAGLGSTATTTANGTSFAAPAVAATIARLAQFASNRFTAVPSVATDAQDPRTMKALLLNSATKLAGWGQGSVFGGTAGLTGSLTGGVTTVRQPLDPNQGAGLLNANGAYLTMDAGKKSPTLQPNGLITIVNSAVTPTGWDFNTVKLSLTNTYQVSGQVGGSMAITLDWYRDVAAAVAGTNSILGMANLDLYLYASLDSAFTNVSLTAQSISSIDNVEHLWFTNLPSAYYEFMIGYTGYDSQGGPTVMNEQYGLAWTFTVPEPSSLLLAGLGISTLWWQTKRRRRA
ncbi:MAG TPA: S8 family serine peptidase [Verrucomicrobiae bacterium]|nr:S8 family serine peptidase [Verrucomicrobiae bacterium]